MHARKDATNPRHQHVRSDLPKFDSRTMLRRCQVRDRARGQVAVVGAYRDEFAHSRDVAADTRDDVADLRDRLADGRDATADERDSER